MADTAGAVSVTARPAAGPEFPPGTDGLATEDRDDFHPLQAEAIRRMSPERRWQHVAAAIEMARRIREDALRAES